MKSIIGLITAVFGVIGMLGSVISMRIWVVVIIVFSALKLTGVAVMPWFASVGTLGAISTGLWLLILGLVMFFMSIFVVGLGGYLMKEDL